MSVYDEIFFTENIINVNKIVEKIIFSTGILPVCFYIFTALGLWHISTSYCLFIFCFSAVASVIVYFLNRSQKTQVLSMIVSLLFCTLYVCVLGESGIINITIVFGIVPFISCLYYNMRLTQIITITNLVLILVTNYLRSFTIMDNYLFTIENFSRHRWYVSHAISISLEFIFVFLVSFSISRRSKKSLQTMMDLMLERDKVNKELKEKNANLMQTQMDIIKFVAEVLGSHDLFTGRHVIHTQKYVGIIARQLRQNGCYIDVLTDEVIQLYETAAFLHDIGKIHIPEGVLNKPGRFTEQERELMKVHPAEGNKLLDFLPPIKNGQLNAIAKDMAFYHHEKWDGSGYPVGLKGNEIPLSARIMAAADVLDALVSQRLYKNPMSFDMAMKIFEEERGTHFEPCIVDAVLSCRGQLESEDVKFKEKESAENEKELNWWKEYHEKLAQLST